MVVGQRGVARPNATLKHIACLVAVLYSARFFFLHSSSVTSLLVVLPSGVPSFARPCTHYSAHCGMHLANVCPLPRPTFCADNERAFSGRASTVNGLINRRLHRGTPPTPRGLTCPVVRPSAGSDGDHPGNIRKLSTPPPIALFHNSPIQARPIGRARATRRRSGARMRARTRAQQGIHDSSSSGRAGRTTRRHSDRTDKRCDVLK